METIYTVWAGGTEINDYYLTEKQAIELAQEYINNGYDDIDIEKGK